MSKLTGKNFNCETCYKEFYRSGWQIKRGPQRFCSLGCRRHSLEAKQKMSQSKKGKPAWNSGLTKYDDPRIDYYRPTKFKDEGKTDSNMKLRKSPLYKWWRTSVFKRDSYICQVCHIKGGKLNADHIKRFSDFPDLRFIVSNGITICEKCHKNTPTFGRFGIADSTEYYQKVGTNYYAQGGANFS